MSQIKEADFQNKLHLNQSDEEKEIIATNDDDLSDKEWYWSKISRTLANHLLHGRKDGTFLVRDSTNNQNDKTLTVKKDGINKMMRIICKNGKYGFSPDKLEFNSLQELIEFHTKNSLSEYYPEMKIKLEYPLSKSNICSSINLNTDTLDIDVLKDKFKDLSQQYLELTQEYEENHRDYKNCQDEMQKFKQSLHCFEETFAIFEGQIKLNEENHKEAMEHEREDIAKNRLEIVDKLIEIKEFRNQLEKQCEETNNQSIILDRKINELKPLLNEKKRLREQIKAILISLTGNCDEIEKFDYPVCVKPDNCQTSDYFLRNSYNYTDLIHHNQPTLNYTQLDKEFLTNSCSENKITNYSDLDNSSFINSPTSNYDNNLIKNDDQNDESNYLGLENCDFDKNNLNQLNNVEWYVGDLSKEDVNVIMRNQPDSTFLVRDSKNKPDSPYTLTVRIHNSTKMLRILQSTDNTMYGFSPDKLEFDSVIKLIDHYLKEPLIISKPDLTILLKYPITKQQIKNYLNR